MGTSNTIGVFLETITPSSGAYAVTKGSSELLTEVIGALARHGGKETIAGLGKQLGISPSQYMDAVFVGRERGLLDFREENDQQVVELTKLGAAFSVVS